MPFGNKKKYFKEFFSSVLSQFKKYQPSGNLNSIIWAFSLLKIAYFHGKIPFNLS